MDMLNRFMFLMRLGSPLCCATRIIHVLSDYKYVTWPDVPIKEMTPEIHLI